MDQDLSSHPQSNKMSDGEPVLGLPKTTRAITFQIVPSAAYANCKFWFGFSKGGPTAPPDLLKEIDAQAVLNRATDDGISDTQPLMLADAETNPAQYFYLRPIPEWDETSKQLWFKEFTETINSLTPSSIGLFLKHTALTTHEIKAYFKELLRKLVKETLVTDVYLLVGPHPLNGLLNEAFKLKSELESHELKVYLYH